MLKNYYKVDENTTVGTFLKEITQKKNFQYLILNTSPESFVDIRAISLKSKSPDEKLKSLKKSLSQIESDNEDDHLNFLIDSGERIVKTKGGYFDFLDALEFIKKQNFDFFSKPLSESLRGEIFALNEKDKISMARNLLIKKRINLLPVINKLELVGEIRSMDFIVNSLIDTTKKGKANYYDENMTDATLNMPISNLVNKKPVIIDKQKTYGDAIDLLLNKRLASIIVVDENNLYSIISYKDIFRLVKKELEQSKYLIEYTGTSEIYEDEFSLIQNYAKKSMDKIAKISNYNLLKLSLKVHGNKEGSHKKKISVKLLLSHGNHVLHIDKEITPGTSDEDHNNKMKGKWNIPQMVQESLSILENKVKNGKVS